MANIFNSNPVIIDTVAASKFTAFSIPLRVKKIVWEGIAASGNQAVITDGFATLWEATAAAAGRLEVDFNITPLLLPANALGWWVSTLTAGKLYLYV